MDDIQQATGSGSRWQIGHGCIVQDDSIAVKERYLGLHMPGEEGVPAEYITRLVCDAAKMAV